MRLFRKHVCPPREVHVVNNVEFCSHEQLIPIDKRKKYALKLHHGLDQRYVQQITDVIKKSGYKIAIVIDGNQVDFEEWNKSDAGI